MKHQFIALALVSLSPLLAHAECATQADTSILPGLAVQRQSVVLEKKFKRVIHRDCNHDIVTDRVEVVGKPFTQISIAPTVAMKKAQIDDSKVYNRTTCEDEGLANLLGNGIGDLMTIAFQPLLNAQINVTVNADADIFMHVLKNQVNYLDYSFSKCLERLPAKKAGETGDCKTLSPVEKGVVILDVKYNEVHENGVDDIAKSEDECKNVDAKREKNNTKLTRWGNFLSDKLFGASQN
jgi:hypothetical protein